MIPGIDVSHWEGRVDWKKVKAAGVKFAYTKASEADNYTDDTLEYNVNEARAQGIPVGAYHFHRLWADPQKQAERFLNSIAGLPCNLPPVLDFEEQTDMNKTTVQTRLKKWLDLVETGAERKPMIYTSAYYWQSYAASPAWSTNYGLWVANYRVTKPMLPRPWTSWVFWQYNDSLSVPGCEGETDTDWFNGTDEELAALAGIELPPVITLADVMAKLDTIEQLLRAR